MCLFCLTSAPQLINMALESFESEFDFSSIPFTVPRSFALMLDFQTALSITGGKRQKKES